MPGKADDSLPNLHLLVAGGSGAGKTTFARRWYADHPRVALWDPDGSHRARGFEYTDDLRLFVLGLAKGARSRRCRLAFAPEQANEELYQRWCHAIWHVADAGWPLTVVTEELQELTGSGPAREWHKTLLTRGRKYGLRLCYLSQRPQEIDTTTRSQTPHKVTGQLDRSADIRAMSKEIDVPEAQISGLVEANGPVEKRTKLHYIERLPGHRAAPVSIALPRRNRRAKSS